MPLQRGEVLGYDFNRMVVDFTMLNQGKTVRCAISTAAMDDLEGKHDVKADQRVDQFVRLRDAIEERASRKFFVARHHARMAYYALHNADNFCSTNFSASKIGPERANNSCASYAIFSSGLLRYPKFSKPPAYMARKNSAPSKRH